jgi:hypothetical protein
MHSVERDCGQAFRRCEEEHGFVPFLSIVTMSDIVFRPMVLERYVSRLNYWGVMSPMML